jgi:hypothetical protein
MRPEPSISKQQPGTGVGCGMSLGHYVREGGTHSFELLEEPGASLNVGSLQTLGEICHDENTNEQIGIPRG